MAVQFSHFKQGECSNIVGNEDKGCAEPMLDARDKIPNRTSLPDFDRLDNPICHHLKISGSQTPLFDEGFGYGLSPNGIIFDMVYFEEISMEILDMMELISVQEQFNNRRIVSNIIFEWRIYENEIDTHRNHSLLCIECL